MFTLCLTSVSTLTISEPDNILDEYLASIAEEDTAALSSLYHATSAAIYGYALSVLKNTHDAEDILQECYLHIYAAADSYQSEGKPMAWMISITRNLCLQRLREYKRSSDLPEEDWQSYLNNREGISEEDKLVLKECMQSLNNEERQIVVLHAVAGFKHREIASTLHLPLSTVLSKYNRALKKLRIALQKGD